MYKRQIQTTPLGSTLTRVGIGVAVSGVVVALGAVGGTAVVPWDISPVAAGISIHIDLRLRRSASNERGSGNSESKKDLSQGSLMSLPKKNTRLPEPSQGRCGNGICTKKGAVSLSLLRKLKVPLGGTTPSENHHLQFGGGTVGAVSVFQEKTQECLTSWVPRSHAIRLV